MRRHIVTRRVEPAHPCSDFAKYGGPIRIGQNAAARRVLTVDAALGHAAVHYFEPFLALAAADDLADPRRQHVHRHDSASLASRQHIGHSYM